MKNKKTWIGALGACSALLLGAGVASAQMDDSKMMESTGAMKGDMMSMRARNAQMLIQTLSEEKTEINALAGQQAAFKKMGGRDNLRIAAMWGRWIREHKAAGPGLMKLIKQNGGDPMQAKILKAPPLGDKMKMVMATHKDHEAAVMTSQMRYGMTNSMAIKMAMSKRAALARKHLGQMKPMHNAMMMAQGAMCPHCNVKMKDGKCPMCGMTMAQMNSPKMAQGEMCTHCNVKMKDGKCPMCGMTTAQMKAEMKK